MKRCRSANIKRKTQETDIQIYLNIDGSGKASLKLPLDFLGHMLNLLAKHAAFDLKITAKGDTKVDLHHTNEDIAICLGLCLKQALGKKEAIKRFGFASVPLDESLVEVSLDLSARPYLKFTACKLPLSGSRPNYSLSYLKQFLLAFVNAAGITLHAEVVCGEDNHHIIEAAFKALARALREACAIDLRLKGIPSTKGLLL